VTVLEVEQRFLDKVLPGSKNLWRVCRAARREGRDHGTAEGCDQGAAQGTTNKADLADCDIVIEAIIENVEEKKKMYASIDGVVKKDAIFASNTSSISVTELLTR